MTPNHAQKNLKGIHINLDICVNVGLFGFANVYAMRVNLSVAIVDMVDTSNSSKHR